MKPVTALLLAAALAAPGCANDAITCLPESSPRLVVEQACLDSGAGRDYVLDAGHRLGDRISSWRTHPGRARLWMWFDASGAVESACVESAEGRRVAIRSRSAAAELRRMPPAPACFADRRLAFEWESPRVTGFEVEQTHRQCRSAGEQDHRLREWCDWAQKCTYEEVVSLDNESKRQVTQCVLLRVPLPIFVPSERKTVYFSPVEGSSPDGPDAIAALSDCGEPSGRSALVACMSARGWEVAK